MIRFLFELLKKSNCFIYFLHNRLLIYTNSNLQSEKCDQVVFEFYLTSYDFIFETLDQENEIDQTLTMDLDHIWSFSLKILNLFEESITSSYPSKMVLIYIFLDLFLFLI